METEFGKRIRQRRIELEIGLNEMAERIKISGAYLSRLETGKETNPSEDIIVNISHELRMDPNELLSLARKIPSDIAEFIHGTPRVPEFLREAQKRSLSDADWQKLIEDIKKSNPE